MTTQHEAEWCAECKAWGDHRTEECPRTRKKIAKRPRVAISKTYTNRDPRNLSTR